MDPGRIKKVKYYALLLMLFSAGGFLVFQNKAQGAVGINNKINFQGKVVNSDGTNVANGSYPFVFKIYDQQAPGGVAVWTDTENVTVTDGIFQYDLGSDIANAPLPGSVNFDTDNIFLGVEFNSNGEMDPRIQFTASPYAFNADNLDGKGESAFALLAGRAGGQTLIGGTASGDDLTFQTTSDVTKGSYIFSELGDGLVLSTSGTLSTVTNTLHAQNTDTGTTGVSFILGSATNSTTTDTFLQFGSTGPEYLTFDGDNTDNFLLTDDLDITGGLITSDDVIAGGSSLAAPFSVDVSGNIVRIGDADTTNNAFLNMYGADGDTGSLEYTTNDSWYFNGGNVGIGTNNPGALLHAFGITEQLRLGYDANSYASFTVADTTSNLKVETAEGTTQSMIKIGKNSAQDAGVTFDGNTTSDYYVGMDASDGAFHIGLGQAIGTTPYLTILSDGKVGLGDITPAFGSLVVANGVNIGSDTNANALIDFETNGAGSTVLYIGQNTIDTTAPSDRRLKQNIVDTGLKLEQLLSFDVVDFQYVPGFTTDQSLHHGLIAQEVEAIYPYAVSVRSDGFKMINYDKLIPLIIQAMQEQNAQVVNAEKLSQAIEQGALTLEERVAQIEKSVANLKESGLEMELGIIQNDAKLNEQQLTLAKMEEQLAMLTQTPTIAPEAALPVVEDASLTSDGLTAESLPIETAAIQDEISLLEILEIKTVAFFRGAVEFFGQVVFHQEVEFADAVIFNTDTAGYAIIPEGESRVKIEFEKAYAEIPVVNASLSLQASENAEMREAAEELLLISDIKFIVTNVTTQGFEIAIYPEALSDIPFSWHALNVRSPRTFRAETIEENVISEIIPEITETVATEIFPQEATVVSETESVNQTESIVPAIEETQAVSTAVVAGAEVSPETILP